MPSPNRRLSVVLAAAMFTLALSAPSQDRGQGAKPKPKRYVLVFKMGTSAYERQQACVRMGLREVEDFSFLNIVVAVPDAGARLDSADSQAAAGDDVEGVEEDFYANWIKSDQPSLESAFSSARAFTKSVSLAPRAPAPSAQPAVPWGIERVGAPKAWNRRDPATMGAGVKVAVVDTGIDCGHPDLQCDASAGFNALDEESAPDDDNGHGTHVAGTIGGKGQAAPDGKLVYGVAPMATLIPVKVLDKDGGGALSDVVRGINWAAQSGVDIISMSLGSPKGSPTLQKAVKAAYDRGVTVVAAAGNSGAGNGGDTVGYPGRYPEAIAVAASDQDDNIADFSSRGPEVAFTAPGVGIESTWPGGGYKTLSGTSMATPHLSGLAALVIAAGARGTERVRQALARASKRLCHVDICPPSNAQGGGMPSAVQLAGGSDAVLASAAPFGLGGR